MPPTARPLHPRSFGRRLAVLAACATALATTFVSGFPDARAKRPVVTAAQAATPPTPPPREIDSIHGSYEPQHIVVKYASPSASSARAARLSSASSEEDSSTTRLLRLPAGANLGATLAKLRREKQVVWAVPDYVAHATAPSIPNDPGTGPAPGDWQLLQWNFDGPFGINAPQAWSNVAADGAPGGLKVVVAVLDTGVAYANRGPYRRSPDFSKYSFVQGYDFIARTPYPNDHNGHGTFVAGTIAESTNNHYGLTGLAYAARIMPVRVLDSSGEGDASVIAEGVRFAVRHHARVINLSLEFSSDVTASDIPELIEALRFAYRHRVLVVAAAGNEGSTTIPYPARAPHVIAVGATTEHGCLASYSNYGRAHRARRARRRPRRKPPRRPQLQYRTPHGQRHLPDDIHGLLAAHIRLPNRL